jgi:hypothetical protein
MIRFKSDRISLYRQAMGYVHKHCLNVLQARVVFSADAGKAPRASEEQGRLRDVREAMIKKEVFRYAHQKETS